MAFFAPDPAAFFRTAARFVRPGGVIASQEPHARWLPTREPDTLHGQFSSPRIDDVERVGEALAARHAALGAWNGSIDELEALSVPDEHKRRNIAEELTARQANFQSEIDRLTAEAAVLETDEALITDEEAARSRTGRGVATTQGAPRCSQRGHLRARNAWR